MLFVSRNCATVPCCGGCCRICTQWESASSTGAEEKSVALLFSCSSLAILPALTSFIVDTELLSLAEHESLGLAIQQCTMIRALDLRVKSCLAAAESLKQLTLRTSDLSSVSVASLRGFLESTASLQPPPRVAMEFQVGRDALDAMQHDAAHARASEWWGRS